MAKTKSIIGSPIVTKVLKSEKPGDPHAKKAKNYNNVGKKPTFTRRHGADNRR